MLPITFGCNYALVGVITNENMSARAANFDKTKEAREDKWAHQVLTTTSNMCQLQEAEKWDRVLGVTAAAFLSILY